MSSRFVRPESSFDRLAFLVADKAEKIKLFDPSLERVFRCTGCGMDIAVGPCFEHIDPEGYVGIVCGCLTPDVTGGPDGAFEGVGMAGNGQEAQPSG